MRKKISKFRFSVNIIPIFLLFLVLSSTFSLSALSSEKQLYIGCLDEVEENKEFLVSVYTYNESLIPKTQNDVNITFQEIVYPLTEEILSLVSSSVDEDTDFLITASKTGFLSADKTITVLDVDSSINVLFLKIVAPGGILIKPDEQFYVIVKDQDDNPVDGATVFIQNFGSNVKTDPNGNAILQSSKDGETIIVKVKKDGYEPDSLEFTLIAEKSFWQEIIEHRLFPLFAAFIVLVIAVIFVHFRQKRSIYTRAKQISDKKVVEKYTSSDESFSNAKKYGYDAPGSPNGLVHVRPSNDSKVEEIRIIRPQKQKEVVPVKTKKDIVSNSNSKSNKVQDSDWFQGTDEIKYELDRLTGEIDEEGIDKWFEGVDELKDKVKERMKKKKKDMDDNSY